MKLVHWLFIILAGVGILYVFHMYSAHNGSQILPGLGLGK